MVWFGQRTVTSSVSTSASADDSLEVVRKPATLAGLNPLFLSIVECPQPNISDSVKSPSVSKYIITERIPIVGSLTFDRSFPAEFTQVEDGVDARVDAGLGVNLLNKWRVRKDEMGTVIEETIELQV
jgi:hypothetical protein